MTAIVRDAEVISTGTDTVVVTFVTDPGESITTRVGDHEIATSGPIHVARFTDLPSDTEFAVELEGHAISDPHFPSAVRTLPVPRGRLLAHYATVNDVHFGETSCGQVEGVTEEELGPVLRSPPGELPYPETMNRSAIAEIAAVNPEAVVVKGDLTCRGTEEEYALFLDAYGTFGDRLHHVRGNHDAIIDATMALQDAPFAFEIGGVTLAVLDTVLPGSDRGQLSAEQAGWLNALAGEATGSVFVFGHHHLWDLNAESRSTSYFGINPDDSDMLAGVVAANENIVGYFAGHTHRHRIRRFSQARDVPFVEVSCTKDYPGVWAEYHVYEGGYTQTVHRIGTVIPAPKALEWTERTRPMFAGLYRDYALGSLSERCFTQTY